MTEVTVTDQGLHLLVVDADAVALEVGIQGPQGPPGVGGASLPWQVASSPEMPLQAMRGYFVDAPWLVRLLLPADGSEGDRIIVSAESAAGWRIAQNVDQRIRVGDRYTTTGITGRIDSTSIGDGIELVCVNADLWVALTIFGTIDVV